MKPNHQTALCVLDKEGNTLRYSPGTMPIYSITKTLIASAILTTDVDLDTSIHTWIDPGLCPHPVTVSQLLNHTSGLSDYGALPAYKDAIDAGNPWSDAEFARHTLQQPLLFEPGTHFAYSNPGYFLLKSILEAVTDHAFTEIMQTLIFEPFEMASARVARGQFATDLAWYPAEWVWHGLVLSDPADVARFMARLPHRYGSNNVRVEHAFLPWRNPHYGNGLMIEPDSHYGHNGNGPGYSASCMHFIHTGITGCVIQQTSGDKRDSDLALTTLLAIMVDLGVAL